jgi:hypothetical protein
MDEPQFVATGGTLSVTLKRFSVSLAARPHQECVRLCDGARQLEL